MKPINTFGIDYQQTLTVACLREGHGMGGMCYVGDGQRNIFPNAVARLPPPNSHRPSEDGSRQDLWASEALQRGTEDVAQGNPMDIGAWQHPEGAARFWRGLHTRFYSYLGRCEPTLRNGYRLMLAVPEWEGNEGARLIQQILISAGLPDTTLLSSADALLCRWIEQIGRVTVEQKVTVAVIAVGDTATQVAAYRVIAPPQGLARPIARRNAPALLQVGHITWMQHLRDCVNERLPEPLPDSCELAIRDACLEFAARLSAAQPDETLIWHGPGRGRLNPPLELEPADCASWSSNSDLDQLMEIVTVTTASLSGSRQPDLILVGGVGAAWPFVVQRAKQLAPVWQSGVPHQDIARGATLWPEIGEGISLADTLSGHPQFAVIAARRTSESLSTQTEAVQLAQREASAAHNMDQHEDSSEVMNIVRGSQQQEEARPLATAIKTPVPHRSDTMVVGLDQALNTTDCEDHMLNPFPTEEATMEAMNPILSMISMEDNATVLRRVADTSAEETQKWYDAEPS